MKKRSTLDSSKNIIDNRHYAYEKKLIRLRKEVNRLYFEQGLSKNKIASIKRVSKHFVIRWTQSMHQDFEQDHRGWPKKKGSSPLLTPKQHEDEMKNILETADIVKKYLVL